MAVTYVSMDLLGLQERIRIEHVSPTYSARKNVVFRTYVLVCTVRSSWTYKYVCWTIYTCVFAYYMAWTCWSINRTYLFAYVVRTSWSSTYLFVYSKYVLTVGSLRVTQYKWMYDSMIASSFDDKSFPHIELIPQLLINQPSQQTCN